MAESTTLILAIVAALGLCPSLLVLNAFPPFERRFSETARLRRELRTAMKRKAPDVDEKRVRFVADLHRNRYWYIVPTALFTVVFFATTNVILLPVRGFLDAVLKSSEPGSMTDTIVRWVVSFLIQPAYLAAEFGAAATFFYLKFIILGPRVGVTPHERGRRD